MGNVSYTVRSFNPKIIGDQGIVGDQGSTGDTGLSSPPSLYLAGENYDPVATLTLNDAWQTFLSKTVANHKQQAWPTALITGQYFVVFRGEVNLFSVEAYVGIRILYDGDIVANTTRHIGLSDLTVIEAETFDYSADIQTQGRIEVTDVTHLIQVQFINLAHNEAKDPQSLAQVYRGSIEIIRAETITP